MKSEDNFSGELSALFPHHAMHHALCALPYHSTFPIPNSTFQTSPSPLVEPLTTRELDVLDQLARRLSNKEIADKLFVSATTVKGHLQNIYQNLEVGKRREAVEKAKKVGIL